MQKVIPSLWFDNQSEEAAKFYTAAFKDSKILSRDYYTDVGKEQHGHNAGDLMSVWFQVEGFKFMTINGGPLFKLNPSISFFVNCKTEDEVKELWAKLSQGGEALMPLDKYPFSKLYGWVSDKFGVSWQIILAEDGKVDPKIVTSLLFTQNQCGKAEEAMKFYASVFPGSRVGDLSRYPAGPGPDKEGTITYGEFTIMGQKFTAMDSAQSHDFVFNEAISLMVECDTQQEIDNYWQKLSAVPEAEACGWLKDKYGVSWQIVPKVLDQMLKNGTPEQVKKVTAAFLKMKKFDIKALEQAYGKA